MPNRCQGFTAATVQEIRQTMAKASLSRAQVAALIEKSHELLCESRELLKRADEVLHNKPALLERGPVDVR